MTQSQIHPAALAFVALGAAIGCAIMIVVLRPLLQRYALARPNARSSHRVPTPQGAGIAVIAATLSIGGAAAVVSGNAAPIALLGAVPLIALVGLVDDIRPIPVLPRLLLQTIAVGALIVTAPADLHVVPKLPTWLERGVLLIAGLWFVNLVNFMDGLDLMTVVEVVPITATMTLLGLSGEIQQPATILAAALCGAMLGFAPFNRPVAKVFLGDVGSLPIGLLLGWCLLQLAWHQQLTAALLLPLYYLADASITLLRRIARREPFWAAHRSHFYQLATDNGFTVARVTAELFALNLVLALLAVASTVAGSALVHVLAGAAGAAAVTLQLHRFSRKRTR